MDGQTLRGPGSRTWQDVLGLARAQGICLAQVAPTGKGRERAAIPQGLALLDVDGGARASLDAPGFQLVIAAQLHRQGGHYLLAPEQN